MKATSWLGQLIRRGGLHKKREIVLRHKRGGNLLDVGCATGDFLSLMSEDGRWKVFGVETDAEAAGCAARIDGAEVWCGRAEEVEYPPSTFDVVTMWHALEHLHDPKRALTRVRRALRHDGVLVVAVPVLDSFDARFFGRYWSGYDVPRHLSTFSMATLSRMLVSAGFSSVNFESFIGGYDAFGISVGFWADDRIKARRVRSLIRIASRSLALRVLMVPYFTAANILRRGSTVVAVATCASSGGAKRVKRLRR
jgi:SAM-dependent methyltransferase